MRQIWFIRHGESESNAGLPSNSDQSTPLTPKGKKQAAFVADYIKAPPDLFVVSPYLRTLETAKPVLEKFPQTSVETWPIHEYTYLSHEQYKGTTSRQRREPSRKYFMKADPDKILGPGGESFNQFIGRIQSNLQHIRKRDEEFIILFGHGWFMRAILWHKYQKMNTDVEKEKFIKTLQGAVPNSSLLLNLAHKLGKHIKKNMFHFLLFSSAVQTPNCSILKFNIHNHTNQLQLSECYVKHLPENLRKTTLSNR